MRIINLSGHAFTRDLFRAGVEVLPDDEAARRVRQLVRMAGDEPPTFAEICVQAARLVRLAEDADATHAVVDGPAHFAAVLVMLLLDSGIAAVVPHWSVRQSSAGGTKVAHAGFVTLDPPIGKLLARAAGEGGLWAETDKETVQ